MTNIYSAIKVSDHVYWVGAIDWSIRDFHGYTTPRGSTYNAYLILADKITLIDTVKKPFMEEMLARIASVIDPAKIDYIVSNHSEQDHCGCLSQVVGLVKPSKVFASAVGVKNLNDILHNDYPIQAVREGETLSLGNMELTFMETRMIHWPDSMFTYLAADGLLFSQDAFGMHLATFERFADELPADMLEYEAATYYANIVLPYSPVVLKAMERVAATGWAIKIIAPDHGPVWRKDLGFILERYQKWAEQKPSNKAVVLYATMWHSTEMMARAIAEALAQAGVKVKILSLNEVHRSEVIFELLDAGALIVGSSTLNNNMLPQMADGMTYIKGLKPANLAGAVFGSFVAGMIEHGREFALQELVGVAGAEVTGGVGVAVLQEGLVLGRAGGLGECVGEHLDALGRSAGLDDDA